MPTAPVAVTIVTNIPEIIEVLDEIVDLDYTADIYDEYWCINIQPFKCNCGQVVAYAQCGAHSIIIWEHKDDENLLLLAAEFQRLGFDPNIIHYNRYLGDCVEFNKAVELGWMKGGLRH